MRQFARCLVVFLVAGLSSLTAAAGPIRLGDGGMQRVGKLTLSSTFYSGLYGGAIDPAAGYAYFGTANSIDPGRLIKVNIQGALPFEVGATMLRPGEVNLDVVVLDPAAGYGYIGTTGSHIIKFALGAGDTPPAYVASLTLAAGETLPWGAVIDTRDPNPAKHYIYFATGTAPGRIVKVAPGDGNSPPTRVSALTLQAGEDRPRRAVVDLASGHAYFATAGFTSPKIIKIALTSGTDLPARVGTVLLEPNDPSNHGLGSAVIDTAAGYAYFGTYDAVTIPARVYKVALGGSGPPALVGSLTLGAGERELSTAVIEPGSGYAYFGTDHTYPGKVYQVRLGAGASLPTETGVLSLQGGTMNPPPDGQNVINKPETLYGEVFLQSGVFDPVRGFAYFGTDSNHGQVVKVLIPGDTDTPTPTPAPSLTPTPTFGGPSTPTETPAKSPTAARLPTLPSARAGTGLLALLAMLIGLGRRPDRRPSRAANS